MIGLDLVDQVFLCDAMRRDCWNSLMLIREDFPRPGDSIDLNRSVIQNWSYRMMQPYCNRVKLDGGNVVYYGFYTNGKERKKIHIINNQ